jgi:phosphopentomutase
MKGLHNGRVVLITLDGVGVGALPDAGDYGDAESNTLLHVAQQCGGLKLPVLCSLGLGNILPLPGVPAVTAPRASFGRMLERSAGKDSTTGHWELAGVIQQEPLPTYPQGFPAAIIEAFSRQTGLEPLGNIAASGTDILRLLGEEHLRSGRPIVYTSADSVFQIAAHEKVMPPERLYDICRVARELLNPWRVGRVIASPFIGRTADSFRRTGNRHDFSLPPVGITILDLLLAAEVAVFGIGKIHDLFAGRGLSGSAQSTNNSEGMAATAEALHRIDSGLVFTNLVDFDMLYGHRLDAIGFGRALELFDKQLGSLLDVLRPGDLLILTADHGCDPTTPGTDHTRESVPLLAFSPGHGLGVDLGTRQTFADVAATIGDYFAIKSSVAGGSFLGELAGSVAAGQAQSDAGGTAL